MNHIIKAFNKLKEGFDEKMIQKKLLEKEIEEVDTHIINLGQEIEDGKKVEIMFQEIAQRTQQNVEDHISNLVTLALKSVSPDFPDFLVQFNIRRNQLEADLLFEENGLVSNPMYCSGGGPKDIGSFGLIIANWSMDKTRASIILDEPFKQVSPDLQENVSQMIQTLSKELGLQFIMVSHAEDINVSADKTFIVEQINGKSTVKEEG